MSVNLTDKHVRYQQTINFDRPVERKQSDSLHISKSVNGWSLGFSANENGKISISASKTMGRLGKDDNEATVKFILESTDHRVPAFKNIGLRSLYNPDFVEVDDRLDRTTESFKKESEYYKREYPASSVLMIQEFFNEMIPEFQELVKDKQLGEHVSKIANEVSKVQQPYNRNYIKVEK